MKFLILPYLPLHHVPPKASTNTQAYAEVVVFFELT